MIDAIFRTGRRLAVNLGLRFARDYLTRRLVRGFGVTFGCSLVYRMFHDLGRTQIRDTEQHRNLMILAVANHRSSASTSSNDRIARCRQFTMQV